MKNKGTSAFLMKRHFVKQMNDGEEDGIINEIRNARNNYSTPTTTY
jgi:hypothetical protein